MLAKPFVANLDGHADGVSILAKNPNNLGIVLSGAADGELRTWHVPSKACLVSLPGAHRGWVRGISVTKDSNFVLSCGDDATVRVWKYTQGRQEALGLDTRRTDGHVFHAGEIADASELRVAERTGTSPFTGIDASNESAALFATSGEGLSVWDVNRADPIHRFEWGVDTVNSVRYNPVQTDLIASTASDRSLALYDVRQEMPIRKLILAMRSNAVAWNPTEAMNLVVANEDSNLYTFDMRKLDIASNIHKGHTGAVMSVDFAPTGREFVSGSYDKTVRLFGATAGHSRDIYHTKRMQRVFSVLYTQDAKYVLSGSDDFNVRIWRAHASETARPLLPRERQARNVAQTLAKAYQHVPIVKKITTFRRTPKTIRAVEKREHEIAGADRRKEENRNRSRKEPVAKKPARQVPIIAEKE